MLRRGVKTWSRWFVTASAAFAVLWQVGVLVGVPTRTAVHLAVLGFVFHLFFGKAYLLVPSYAGRVVADSRLPGLHLAASATGTALLAVGEGTATPALAVAGAVAWCLGVAAFLAALGWTLRDAILARLRVPFSPARDADSGEFGRWFVPAVLAYLVAGSLALLARVVSVTGPFGGYAAPTTHLLAAGVAVLAVFAFGVRLLPRFLGVDARPGLAAAALVCGSVAPALLAGSFGGGWLFRAGAVLESAAVVGFAGLFAFQFWRSDRRRRVGLWIVGVGLLAGVCGVAFGLRFAFAGWTPTLAAVHRRVQLAGFLGLTLVGFAFQFYPPSSGSGVGASDRGGAAVAALLAGGLVVELAGRLLGVGSVRVAGTTLICLGTAGYAVIVVGVLRALRNR